MSVAIIGDSFVHRLGNYLRAAHVDALGLHGQFHSALYLGLSGASVFGCKTIQPLLDCALAIPNLRA
jgi:hypothetical protein